MKKIEERILEYAEKNGWFSKDKVDEGIDWLKKIGWVSKDKVDEGIDWLKEYISKGDRVKIVKVPTPSDENLINRTGTVIKIEKAAGKEPLYWVNIQGVKPTPKFWANEIKKI